MFGEVSGGYVQTSTGTEILSLPFEDDNYAMVFVLPQTGILLVLMTTNK
jgi:hypothetical protein